MEDNDCSIELQEILNKLDSKIEKLSESVDSTFAQTTVIMGNILLFLFKLVR